MLLVDKLKKGSRSSIETCMQDIENKITEYVKKLNSMDILSGPEYVQIDMYVSRLIEEHRYVAEEFGIDSYSRLVKIGVAMPMDDEMF